MFKAVRAFIRFRRYPETRPHRWRAFRAQSAKSLAYALHYVLLSPVALLGLLTWPIAWVHEIINTRRFWFPTDPLIEKVDAYYKRRHRELNPLYLAAENKANGKDNAPGLIEITSD